MVNDTANTTRNYRLPRPPCVYDVDGSKPSSSQNRDSPDWSLGHLRERGLSEGRSNGVLMEQWWHLTEMVCWPAVSPSRPSAIWGQLSCWLILQIHPSIPGTWLHALHMGSPQYTVVEMNFAFLPLEQSIFAEQIWQPLMDLKVHALSATWAMLPS